MSRSSLVCCRARAARQYWGRLRRHLEREDREPIFDHHLRPRSGERPCEISHRRARQRCASDAPDSPGSEPAGHDAVNTSGSRIAGFQGLDISGGVIQFHLCAQE